MRSSTCAALTVAAVVVGVACGGDERAGVELPGLAGAPVELDVEQPPPLPTTSAPDDSLVSDTATETTGDPPLETTVETSAVPSDDAVAAGDPATASAEPPAPTTVPDVFLRRGDSGPEVAAMQRLLVVLDYLPVGGDTGTFDGATADALIDFQAQYGLVVDGIFGPESDRALRAAAASVEAG